MTNDSVETGCRQMASYIIKETYMKNKTISSQKHNYLMKAVACRQRQLQDAQAWSKRINIISFNLQGPPISTRPLHVDVEIQTNFTQFCPPKCSLKFLREREMKDFPSCFGENGVQVADSSSSNSGKNAQNLVACVYQCRIRGRNCLITVTWTKNLMGQSVTVGVDDSCSNQSLCKVEIKPWLFTKRKGSKSLEAYSCKIDVFWDLSSAKFGSGPEALGGFYVGVVVDKEMVLLLGDMKKEAFKKTNASPSSLGAVFVAKKEHVFGKRVFATKAQLCADGKIHDVVIECDTGVTDPCLVFRVDGKTLLQVKRLKWKFRGNDTIVVNRTAVEVLWDVHSWLFGMPSAGNAVFMFRTCQSSLEKSLSFSQDIMATTTNPKSQSFGFSLILYAWKNE
ncbi:hypothetical protein Bca101_014793 [Brassica carinata]